MKRVIMAALVGVTMIAGAVLAQDQHNAGDKVKVEWKGQWYPAVVKNYNAAKKCWNIHYDNYSESWDECVGNRRIK